MKRNWKRPVVVLATLSIVAAACGGDDDDAEPAEEPAAEEPAAEEPAAEEPAGEAAAFTLFGAPTGVEGDALQGFLDVYNAQTGSDITFTGSDQF
jgi:hypothetical protein